jgi:MraZ protein
MWYAGSLRRPALMGDLEQMFLGHYDHNIDDKGRLTIPARYRELLAAGAYITLGLDGNLIVMTAALFEQLSSEFKNMNMIDPATRSLSRLFFSYAQQLETDRVGRILIPQFLREKASLDSNAVVAGVGDYFEIWEPSSWAKQDQLLQDPAVTAQRFAALNLSA